MAKIKIQGNASGTGVVTLTAPNTNTDRTITLPDGDISLGVGIDDNATSTAITIDASEQVGIGIASPTEKLHIVVPGSTTTNVTGIKISNDQDLSGENVGISFGSTSWGDGATIYAKDLASDGKADLCFGVRISGAPTEKARITANGLTFNGDTAAANALDDYEEGTWTPTFGGATISAGNTVGYYTKIGRQVFFQWYSSASTISSASGGAEILGLPFTTSSSSDAYGLFTYQHGTALDGGCRGGFINRANTNMHFIDTNGTAKASYVNGTQYIMISGTYFTA